jgi:hypothetical protein
VSKVVSIEAGRGRSRKPPRKVTPELLWELVRIHSQCVYDQQGKCPLTVFVKPLAWELNQAMNLPDEESEGFRRVDPLCAAKPLNENHGALPVKTWYREDDNGDV